MQVKNDTRREEDGEPIVPVPFVPAPTSSGRPAPDLPVIHVTAAPTRLPTTNPPTTAEPTASSPTTARPSTTPPTSAAPTTAPPTPSPTHDHHHHYSRLQHFEIDSSIVISFSLVCLVAILYKKRRKLPLYLMRLKYYLCCCRMSARELVQQQEEHATLNDFIFEVERTDETGRVNMSGLTPEYGEDDEQTTLMPPSVVEVSIQSIFPDILGQEMAQSQQQPQREPLLPPGGAGAY